MVVQGPKVESGTALPHSATFEVPEKLCFLACWQWGFRLSGYRAPALG